MGTFFSFLWGLFSWVMVHAMWPLIKYVGVPAFIIGFIAVAVVGETRKAIKKSRKSKLKKNPT